MSCAALARVELPLPRLLFGFVSATFCLAGLEWWKRSGCKRWSEVAWNGACCTHSLRALRSYSGGVRSVLAHSHRTRTRGAWWELRQPFCRTGFAPVELDAGLSRSGRRDAASVPGASGVDPSTAP